MWTFELLRVVVLLRALAVVEGEAVRAATVAYSQ
jgi:hypothetical protein